MLRTFFCLSALVFGLLWTTTASAIKVLSYNVCWECMSHSSTGTAGLLGETCTWTTKNNVKITICGNNIAKQIDNISHHYGADIPFDFVGLQEAKNWENLQQVSKALKNLKVVPYKVVSFYDGNKYNLQKTINTEFEPGRPIQILIFKEGIIFVNLHAPHLKKGSLRQYIEDKLSSALISKLTNTEIGALKNFRIIVVGDFNDHSSSLYNDNLNGQYFVPFRKAHLLTPVFFSPDKKEEILSCCKTAIPYPKPPKFTSDYIFDSKPKSEFKSVRLKVPSNYDYDLPSSDHLPIIYKTSP